MTDIDRASNVLRRHFETVSPAEFRDATEEIRKKDEQEGDALRALSTDVRWKTEPAERIGQLVLFPATTKLPLHAYLACALTGLEDTKRQLLELLSDTVAQVCAMHEITLYEPRKKTDPVHHAEASPSTVFKIDQERVKSSDLVIHLCYEPSTGSGEELEIASTALIPIILIAPSGKQISRMVTGIPGYKVELYYDAPENLRQDLDIVLGTIRPVLEARKLAFADYEVNLVGDRIRRLREDQGLTRKEVAQAVPYLTVERLRLLEESADKVADPGLLLLRRIATVLKTTVSDLVEPDLMERLFGVLEQWTEGRVAARFGDMSVKDRNATLRRILLKMYETLEDNRG